MNPWNQNPNYTSVTGMLFSHVLLLLVIIGLVVEGAYLADELNLFWRDWQTLAALQLLY